MPSIKHRYKVLLAAVSLALVSLAIPFVSPAVATPTGREIDSLDVAPEQLLANRGVVDATVTVETKENLYILGSSVMGYVNMLDKDDVIYMRPYSGKKNFDGELGYYSRTLVHEYGHILQKRLAEKSSTDRGYSLYEKLLELNAALQQGAPAIDPAVTDVRPIPFSGLETNADCVLNLYSSYTSLNYVDPQVGGCNDKQLAMAKAVVEGDWPTEEAIEKWTQVLEAEKAKAARASKALAQQNCTTVVIKAKHTTIPIC